MPDRNDSNLLQAWYIYHASVFEALYMSYILLSAALRIKTCIRLMNAESNPLRIYGCYYRGWYCLNLVDA